MNGTADASWFEWAFKGMVAGIIALFWWMWGKMVNSIAENRNVLIYTGFTPSMYSEMKVALGLLTANPTVWYGWTEFAGGPAWSENYPGLMEPRSFTSPIADRPQMRLLNAYATGHSWPTASGLWPYNVQFP